MSPRVISLNVGAPRRVEWRGEVVVTGIYKSPVTGRVALRGVNFDGDDQADRSVHGGPDKAVYAYAREDYDYWRHVEGVDTAPGLFGENLTLEGIDLSATVVGERWSVGSTILEVAQPRLPCYKLAMRLDDPRFVKRFLVAKRAGAYLRIIRKGDVGSGDEVHVVSTPQHGVTLRSMIEALRDPVKAKALSSVPNLPEFWQQVDEA
ncbi:MAG: MOSC domain-containing protein [Gemmatimonadaceae bacterium]